MFCSKCGKTVSADWSACRSCGNPIGESRFEGVPYTSAQSLILPGADSVYESRGYTRTTYTGGDYAEEYDNGEVDVRTSYRPAYDAYSVPEEVREDLRAAIAPDEEEMGEEIPEDGFSDGPYRPSGDRYEAEDDAPADLGDFDMSKIKARPIVAKQRAGLSSEVEEYVRKLENAGERPARRGRHMSESDPYADEARAEAEEAAPAEGEGIEEPIPDEDYEEYAEEREGRVDKTRILKIVLALAVVAVLFILGITVVPKLISGFKGQASTPIEGVSKDLYDSGVQLLKDHIADEYVSDVASTFETDSYVGLTNRLNADKEAILAMLPAEPSTNDELFLKAVAAIQDDIGSAITLDTVSNAAAAGTTSDDSETRWKTIRDLVGGFETVNSAAGLNEIVSGTRILAEIVTETPAPYTTPAPQYPTLSKKSEGEDVRKLQERLWELGYLDDDRDGKFGNNTQTAVKLFQQAAGLETTGVADSAMQTILYSDDAPMTANAKVTPAPTPEPAIDPEPAVEETEEYVEPDTAI